MGIFGNLIQPFFEGGGGSVIEAPVEFRAEATYLQWRLTEGDDTTWKNLKTWASLTGADGEDGANGQEISLQKTATHIQWKLGDGEWANLVALADITGPTGAAGTDGEDGADGLGVPSGGTTGQVLSKKSNTDNDTEWTSPSGGFEPGDIIHTYKQTAKTGFLILDGSEVLKATYAALYSAIGDIGGSPSGGSTYFKLPDHRERVAVPAKAGGTFATIGAKGGAETHTLDTDEMPAHTHNMVGSVQANTPYMPPVMVDADTPGTYVLYNSVVTPIAGATSSVGGGEAHNNLQPYIVISTAQIKY